MGFRRPVTARRPTGGQWVKGQWVGVDYEPIPNVRASVQPLRPEEMELLPEGRRKDGAFRLYTSTELRPAEEGQHQADQVLVRGQWHEVLSVGPWQSGVISHFKVIVVRPSGP